MSTIERCRILPIVVFAMVFLSAVGMARSVFSRLNPTRPNVDRAAKGPEVVGRLLASMDEFIACRKEEGTFWDRAR